MGAFDILLNGVGGQLEYPVEIDRLPGYILFEIVNEKGIPTGQPTCKLPLPPTLSHSDKASYEQADLGLFAAFGDQRAGGVSGFTKSQLQNLDKETAGDLVTALTAKVLGNRTEYATKTTPNPNTRSLFKKVGIRSFAFQFNMVPTSPKEGDNIEAIIQYFRTELYPESTIKVEQAEVDGITREVSYLSYKYPNRFKIKFFMGNSPAYEITPFILPCYLESVDVEYNSASVFKGQFPDDVHFGEYILKLQFIESSTLFKTDVEGGY